MSAAIDQEPTLPLDLSTAEGGSPHQLPALDLHVDAPEEGTTRAADRRVRGVDVLRGLVLAVMILTPVTGENGSYPLLAHADWNGFTVSDAVFPAFLVTSGASLAFLLTPPTTWATIRRLVKRLLALLVLGLAYNALGQPLDLDTIRVTGVLQAIGVTGALAAAAILMFRAIWDSILPPLVLATAMPLAYGRSLARAARDCTIEAASCSPWFDTDVRVLGEMRTYRMGQAGFDPEGIAVMVVATSFVLFGYAAATGLRRRPIGWKPLLLILVGGATLIAVGLYGDAIQPINKRLHTPAFTFLAAGIPLVGLAVLSALVDLPLTRHLPARLAWVGNGVRTILAHPFQTLGRNALIVYLLEHAMLTAIGETMARSDTTLRRHLLDAIPIEGDRVHLAATAILLAVVLAVTYLMRILRWRVAL